MTTIIDYAALPPVVTDPTDTRSREIAATISQQVYPVTKLANGWNGYHIIPSGALLSFKLARPYGQRFVAVTLTAWDYYYVTTYRVGKGGKVYEVAQSSDIDCFQLNDTIFDHIGQSV